MADQATWQRLAALTEAMVSAARASEWETLGELQFDRDQLITALPPASNDDAEILQELVVLNQTLVTLTENQRSSIAESLRQGKNNRRGINAYQKVTGSTH
ncbi:MAG: flagellar protein FliT [Immundisolibacteraceae bacterium]|nr:flagellar protein FliT [Immundisolibacteraceae bacterium]